MHVWSKLAASRWRDAWEERVLGLGQTNAVIEALRGGKSIRVTVYCSNEKEGRALVEQFGGSLRSLRSRNWAKLQRGRRAGDRPLKIRDRFVVTHDAGARARSALQKRFPGRGIIVIPPEMAFGTGEHETTATCLRFLADCAAELDAREGSWEQLDLGTGSGILAIAGRLLGARRVEAVDFDPHAVKVAERNVARHGLDGVRLIQRDVLSWKPGARHLGRFACVTANLFSDVLAASFGTIAAVTAPGGIVIASGILKEQAEPCLAAARKAGVSIEEERRRGKWVTFLGRKAQGAKRKA